MPGSGRIHNADSTYTLLVVVCCTTFAFRRQTEEVQPGQFYDLPEGCKSLQLEYKDSEEPFVSLHSDDDAVPAFYIPKCNVQNSWGGAHLIARPAGGKRCTKGEEDRAGSRKQRQGASNTSSSVHQVFPSLIKGESRDLFRQFAGLCVKSVSVYMEVAVNMHHKAAHYSVLIECETGKYLRMDRFRPPESTDANLKDDRLLWSDEPTSLLLGGFRARAWEVPPHQLLRLYFDNTVTLDQIGLGIYVVRSQPYTDAAFNCLWYSLTFISLQRWHMRDHVLNLEYNDKGAHFALVDYLGGVNDRFDFPKRLCIDMAFWQDCLITQCSFLVAMKESEIFRRSHLRAYGEIDFDFSTKLDTYLRDQQAKLKPSRGLVYSTVGFGFGAIPGWASLIFALAYPPAIGLWLVWPILTASAGLSVYMAGVVAIWLKQIKRSSQYKKKFLNAEVDILA